MHQPVILLPGIIAPAAIRYGPLVERLKGVYSGAPSSTPNVEVQLTRQA